MAAKAAQPERERAWDGVVRREIDVEFRSINEDERSFEVVASTETLDSHGDVLKQFWDLSRYQKNGVVLWNHNLALYMGGEAEDTLPIGKALEVRIEGKKLLAKLALLKGDAATEPLVDKIWRRVQQGVLKAVSVGFRPGQVTRKVNAAGETEYYELGSKERPNELREISLVPMGSNPDAVAKSIAWERKHLSREAAQPAAEGSRSEAKTMNEELQKALEAKAVAEQKLKDAEKRAETLGESVKTLETSLTAEKATSAKLEKDLGAVTTELKAAKSELAKASLDTLQGVKFAPAEREELDKLVGDIGLDRVKSLLEKRADITLTQSVSIEGKPLEKSLPAPAPVEGGSADAGASIAAEATKGLN
jgi:phage head maturation protease